MFHQILIVTVLNLLAAMSPGPDFAIVLANSIRGHRATGIATALGIACALTIHMTYCSLGLASLITKTPKVMAAFTVLASLYLCYLGVSVLRSRVEEREEHGGARVSARATQSWTTSLGQGFLTCLLNPKAILFIVALYSTVIRPTSVGDGLFFGIFLVLPALAWFILVSHLLTAKRSRALVLRVQPRVMFIMGWILLLLGIFMLLHFIISVL
jgi:threonine/homoserine/homoserine lactone efflux protein